MLEGSPEFRYKYPNKKKTKGAVGGKEKILIILFSTRGDLPTRSENIMTNFANTLNCLFYISANTTYIFHTDTYFIVL